MERKRNQKSRWTRRRFWKRLRGSGKVWSRKLNCYRSRLCFFGDIRMLHLHSIDWIRKISRVNEAENVWYWWTRYREWSGRRLVQRIALKEDTTEENEQREREEEERNRETMENFFKAWLPWFEQLWRSVELRYPAWFLDYLQESCKPILLDCSQRDCQLRFGGQWWSKSKKRENWLQTFNLFSLSSFCVRQSTKDLSSFFRAILESISSLRFEKCHCSSSSQSQSISVVNVWLVYHCLQNRREIPCELNMLNIMEEGEEWHSLDSNQAWVDSILWAMFAIFARMTGCSIKGLPNVLRLQAYLIANLFAWITIPLKKKKIVFSFTVSLRLTKDDGKSHSRSFSRKVVHD